MQPIRAVVSDMDDTLLTEDFSLSGRTIQTLRRLVAQGVHVIFASGRSAASMRPYAQAIGTPDPIIAYNGAQVIYPFTNRLVASDEIPLPLAREALEWMESQGAYAQYYDGDDWFYEAPSEIAVEYGRSSGVLGTLAGEKLSRHIKKPSPKLLCIGPEAQIQALLRNGRAVFGDRLSITTSKPIFLEITSPTATKGHALEVLAEKIGLTKETTLCCGDSLNDVSMLAWCKMPVAVSNAREEVRAMAWRVAGHGCRDGVAILLDELIPEVPHAD